MKKRIMVVGPQSESSGGVVTFQRNLMHLSSLNERWEFVPYNISRPPKTRAAAHHYKAVLQQDPRRLLKATGITAKAMVLLTLGQRFGCQGPHLFANLVVVCLVEVAVRWEELTVHEECRI